MNLRKEWKIALVALLASASLLPGCGKSNVGNGPGANAAAAAVSVGTTSTASGGVAFAISGTSYQGSQGITANLTLGGQTMAGGQLQYFRTDGPGDQIQLNVNGNTLSGYVYLAPLTLQALGNCSLSGASIFIDDAQGVDTYHSSQYGSSNFLGTFFLLTPNCSTAGVVAFYYYYNNGYYYFTGPGLQM